ncbi:histidine--tRNA ligase [Turicibacter sanguinis]|uniref:histidine--tRNA ligase n=1 Tax=Turicibacter sanguinis TaxID=154288 RepID=UPI003999F43E
MNFNKPKGTYDVLPKDSARWQNVESLIREICSIFNYKEIRTPMFESTQLYHRSAGETSDVVSKETYDFKDRGDRMMTLRPEGTAGVVRSYIENKMYADQMVQKMFYIGSMFRYERQQKGRYRQHIQFGTEVFGSADPSIDAEVISLAVTLYKVLGLRNIKVKLNSLGDTESRENYRAALLAHFEGHKEELCADCQVRLEKNPLRVLDCKVDRNKEIMQSAPQMIDHLTEEDKAYFMNVQKYLKAMGIEYEYDASLVRGFDYYTHTIFEIQAEIEGFGSQNTLCGGGRYNKLVAELGGPTVPAIGFGMGLERLLLALEAENIQVAGEDAVDLFLITLGEDAKVFGSRLLLDLRSRGLACETDYLGKNLKGQFKQADRYHARYTAILGDEELQHGMINIKNNQTGTQESIPVGFVIDYIIEDQQRNHQHGGCCGGGCHDHQEEEHECCGGHGHGDDHECCGGNGHGCGCQH